MCNADGSQAKEKGDYVKSLREKMLRWRDELNELKELRAEVARLEAELGIPGDGGIPD